MSIAATIGAVGAVAGGTIGAVGASSAAGEQASAADSAAALQYKSSQDALAEQKSEFATTQANAAPFLATGTQATTSLAQLLGPGGELTQNFGENFTAPTADQARQTPGYQFTLDQGQQAIENSAAARGNLLSSTTLKGLDQYSQGLADTTYQQTYQNALGEFQQRYNIFNNNQTNLFNRLSALSGGGQQTAASLASAGQASSSNIANILLGSSAQIGNSLQGAGAARASGYAGIANSLGGALGGTSSNIQQLMLLKQLFPNTGSIGSYPGIVGDSTSLGG